SGVYTFLPLGFRVLQRIEGVVREELDRAGCQEMLMPALHPIELWEESGRASLFGSDALPAMVVEARGGTFVLGPTHEEVATATVGAEVDSYRQLPLTVYQVQVKFRDEARPRYGLLRTRELIMCDAYSFDVDTQAMGDSYRAVVEAYLSIFRRLELEVCPVEARAGAIGGEVNHEFMVPSAVGEDYFVTCPSCGYAANVEAAERGPSTSAGPGAGGEEPGDAGGAGDAGDAGDAGGGPEPPAHPELVEHHTPGRPGIDDVLPVFSGRGLGPADLLKTMAAVDGEGRPTVVLVPGDREVRLPAGWRLFEEADFAARPELVRGYVGPMGQQDRGVRVVADHSVRRPGSWVTGANKVDHHVSGAVLGRDFEVDEWGSFAEVVAGDPCPRCGTGLETVRAVEAAHTFQLGFRYSSVMAGGTVAAPDGHEVPMAMGCYGMGVSRLLSVVAEAHHDDAGLCWPAEVAPFDVHLLAVGADRAPEVGKEADRLAEELAAAGIEVLYDDRDASVGVKFADADLLGLPVRLVVGRKGAARGVVEWRDRRTGAERELARDQVVGELRGG
ncbi:MAG TPA: proline--tRNA ligase, partial [Acidimicrobiales bacterium]|nr:proline--tRNA ligase [Acidimicrobiales bacterium]